MWMLEEINGIAEQIKDIEYKIDQLNDNSETSLTLLHQYTDELFKLKMKLQQLEKQSYLERKPDIENENIDLYLKNIHAQAEKDPEKLNYIITLHGTKQIIGETSIRLYLTKADKYLGNIGTNIKEEYRGKRYSKESFLLLKNVMLEKGLVKPIFTVEPQNVSSIKSLETMGAVKTGEDIHQSNQYYIYEYDLSEEKKK